MCDEDKKCQQKDVFEYLKFYEKNKSHAWEYFKSAADQRTQVFYFFVVISGFFWTGIGAYETFFTRTPGYLEEMVVLTFYTVFSIVFYMIEVRSASLVEYGENFIKGCVTCKKEQSDDKGDGCLEDKKLFLNEPTTKIDCENVLKKIPESLTKFFKLPEEISFKKAYKLFFVAAHAATILAFIWFAFKHDDCMGFMFWVTIIIFTLIALHYIVLLLAEPKRILNIK